MDKTLNTFQKALGKKIKKLREQKGLTQSQLGALINKDFQSISRIENGNVNPSAFIVYQIAHALKIEMNEIYHL